MNKCSLTNDSFEIIENKILDLAMKDRSADDILKFLRDDIRNTYEINVSAETTYDTDELTNFIHNTLLENDLNAKKETIFRTIYSDKIIEKMEVARLEEIEKEIQIFQKYGAQIPACLLEEKEKLENRWRGKLVKEIENVLNARFRTMKTDISLIVSYSDEAGWRVEAEE